MYINDIIQTIEEFANPQWQAEWDRSGLQVASSRREIKKMAVMLDAMPAYAQKAIEAGADFILSHHPLSLKPALPNKLNDWHKILKILLCADIPCYAAHTSLDVNLSGPAGWLGVSLELKNRTFLEPVQNENEFYPRGYGEVGDLEKPQDSRAFLKRLIELLHIDLALICNENLLPEELTRVAYCGGSGASLLPLAEKARAQLYITGDVKYHAALEAGIAVLDVGHHSIEEEMMKHFAADLSKRLTDVEVMFIPTKEPFQPIFGAEAKRSAA